jgi:endoglucanase
VPPREWGDAQARSPAAPNPLVGLTWFIDKEWGIPWRKYMAARGEKKRLIGKIATNPQFKWIGRWDVRKYGSGARAIDQYLDRVDCSSPGSVAQVVAFFHEGRSCGPAYLGGGAAEDARYRRTIRSFAQGIGSRRVVIAFEPDSLGTIDCLARHRRVARARTLAYGVRQLAKAPNATVYIDAGAADWMPVGKTAKLLRRVGVSRVRGFMLNATHMVRDGPSIRYGKAVSRRLGGKHFIVNTSDNGRGPMYTYRNGRRQTIWCNPPNSGLGKPATTKTGSRLADALLWVNRPGTSHGACRPPGMRGPSVGQWWEKRALAMARRANW